MIENLLEIGSGPLTKFDPKGTLLVPRTKAGYYLKLITYYLLVLAFSTVVSLALGGIISAAEGWEFRKGFVLALGVATSSNTQLGGTQIITSTGGKICGFFMGIVGAGQYSSNGTLL